MDPKLTEFTLTPLRRIVVDGGDVLHGMKATDPGFEGFGEAYFSMVESGVRKGWKRHNRATPNLIVAVGQIRFMLTNGEGRFESCLLSPDDQHARLTVPPGWWMAFENDLRTTSIVLNICNEPHNPSEFDAVELAQFIWPEAD